MLNYKTIDKKDLLSAFDNNEFSLFYQPIISLKNDCFETFEAFIRWHHPTLGTLPPSLFINKIEQYDLQEKLTGYIINAAIEQILDNNNLGYNETGININLSYREFFNPTTIYQLKTALQRLPNPEYLGLELSPEILTSYTEVNPNDTHYDANDEPTKDEYIFLNNIKNIISEYYKLGVTLTLNTSDEIIGNLIRAHVIGLHGIKISAKTLNYMLIKDPNCLTEHVQVSEEFAIPLIAVGIDNPVMFKNIYNSQFSYAQGYFLCPPTSLKNHNVEEHLNQYIDNKNLALCQENIIESLVKVEKNITENNNKNFNNQSIKFTTTQKDENKIYNNSNEYNLEFPMKKAL